MAMKIKASELSPDNYKPFGQFVCLPTKKPTIQDDIVKYWANLAGFEISGAIDVGWVTMKKRPLLLTQLERHFETVEVVIPLDDTLLLPVAFGRHPFDYQSQPMAEDVRAFYLHPGQMITFAPGTWHFGGFPLNKPEASFMVFTKRGTADKDVSMQAILDLQPIEFTL
jgi:ureidoglycolate hydrolase